MDEEMELTTQGKIALVRLVEQLRIGKRTAESVDFNEAILLVFMAEACKDAGLEVGLLSNAKEIHAFIHGPYTQYLQLLEVQDEKVTLM